MQSEAQSRLCQSCIWCCRTGVRSSSNSYPLRKAVSYYDLSGVKSDASVDEIKNAFFDKSKKSHPDSDPSNPELHSQFVKSNEAYRVSSKDSSRKEYDLKLQHPYQGGGAFQSTSSHTVYRSATSDNVHYWEQFRHAQSPEATAEERKEKKRRNFKSVIYCVITMMLSIGAHMVFFRKSEEVHNNFMDEKDRVITEIYNEAKERARANGFRKQTEISRQKHAEFQEKLKSNKGGQEK